MPETTLEPQTETDLKALARELVSRAMQHGATAAECVIREGDEFSTLVRLGQVETLKESGSRAIGVRVFFGRRSASTHSSDFSRAGLERMLSSALELAKITSEDPFAGIPEHEQLGSIPGELDLYSPDVYSLPGQERIAYARRAEQAALESDARIKNSDGGSFDAATGHKILANSLGFLGEYRRSYCSVSAVPIAQDENGAMQRDYWYSVARSLGRLESPEHVGRVAAERALRRLGARKVKTKSVPVIFDPLVATSILEHIFEGVNGDSVYRGASFLAGKLGLEPVIILFEILVFEIHTNAAAFILRIENSVVDVGGLNVIEVNAILRIALHFRRDAASGVHALQLDQVERAFIGDQVDLLVGCVESRNAAILQDRAAVDLLEAVGIHAKNLRVAGLVGALGKAKISIVVEIPSGNFFGILSEQLLFAGREM